MENNTERACTENLDDKYVEPSCGLVDKLPVNSDLTAVKLVKLSENTIDQGRSDVVATMISLFARPRCARTD